MRFRKLAQSLFTPLLMLAIGSGCQSLYQHRPVPVMVVDAETKKPIPAAEVKFSHPTSEGFDQSSGVTGADGLTRMWATPEGKSFLEVEASASGYVSDSMHVSDAHLQEIKTASLFESTDKRPADIVMGLYKGPAFSVVLNVPAGYRGLVRAEVQIHDEMPCPFGQRCFAYSVAAGTVQVIGPAVLRHVAPAKYTAVYSDGTAIGAQMNATQVGFRWLKHEDSCECFVVGTQEEFDRYRRELFSDDGRTAPAPKSQGGGGKGGKGGGGRGGAGGGNFGGPGGYSQ